jgi:predicted MFS family arabinose efflux permease
VFSSWRAAFLFAAVPGVPLALLMALSLREPARLEVSNAPERRAAVG